jgi:hypothetical protein
MADSGANFTDWQRSTRRQGLLVDDDFSWSDAPTPRRRGEVAAPSRRAASGTITIERGESATPRFDERDDYDEYPDARRYVDFDRVGGGSSTNREYDTDVHEVVSAGYQDDDVYEYDYPEAVDDDGYAMPVPAADVYASQAPDPYAVEPPSGRRTVVITGRGSESYQPARQRGGSDTALTRRGFRPDSVAMWGVLLGIALLLGSIAH